MPRVRTGPERNNRLTALLSDAEIKRAKRIVKTEEGIENLSSLVRTLVDERYATLFPPKRKNGAARKAPKKRAPKEEAEATA